MKKKFGSSLRLTMAFLLSLACILLTLPRQSEKYNYDYETGQPWRYDQLIAPFTFPVHRSAEQFRLAQDSVLRKFAPFFNAANGVGEQALLNFKADYAKGKLQHVPSSYFNHAIKMLEEVYQRGIVESSDYIRLTKDKNESVRIVDGTTATVYPATQILTTRTAYQYVMESESEIYDHDVMMNLNLNEYLEPNLKFDSIKSNLQRTEAIKGIAENDGLVVQGELIVDRGQIINGKVKARIDSWKIEMEKLQEEKGFNWTVLIGQAGIIIILFVLMLLYLYLFRRDLFSSRSSIYLLFFVITFFCVLTFIMLRYNFLSVYILPFAMAPIFVRVFMDTRTAFMAHTVMVLVASLPLVTNYQFVLTEIVAGIVAIYSLRDLTERSQLFKTAGIVTVSMWAMGVFFDLSQGATFNTMNHRWYYYIAVNGIALLSTYPLLYVIERLFGFTSTVTLIELSNTNSSILRKMSKEAQGTFIHSLQVGNLAAEVADKVGAKVQLVRTGALYHDIGKMLNPAFFTENQSDVNPHDSLPEERSAEIIISHVTDGLRLAEKYHLPKVIRDFITTHHGQSLVRYFYVQSCNKHGEENVDKALFTYPGKNPVTLEQAILMMADSVEAASRSLKEYTEENITNLVNRIIDSQVSEGYFKECPITFRDIADAKHVFIDSLKTIYHTRIAYPAMNQQEMQDNPQMTGPSRNRLFGSNTWTWNKKNS